MPVVLEFLLLIFVAVFIGFPVLLWIGVIPMAFGVHAYFRPREFSGGQMTGAISFLIGMTMFYFNAVPTVRFLTGSHMTAAEMIHYAMNGFH